MKTIRSGSSFRSFESELEKNLSPVFNCKLKAKHIETKYFCSTTTNVIFFLKRSGKTAIARHKGCVRYVSFRERISFKNAEPTSSSTAEKESTHKHRASLLSVVFTDLSNAAVTGRFWQGKGNKNALSANSFAKLLYDLLSWSKWQVTRTAHSAARYFSIKS